VSDAPLRLADLTPLSKLEIRATASTAVAAILDCPFGRARRGEAGELIVGSGPDEWLLLSPTGTEPAIAARLPSTGAVAAGDAALVTAVDVTHGRVLLRLTGAAAAAALSKLCAIDLSEACTPDGSAFRSSVARLACLVVRDDVDGTASYLICSDRSSGHYLFEAVSDAGAEFSLVVEGFPTKEI